MSDAVDLADRDVEILELVVDEPGASVSELRELVYWADRNQHIHYRVEKLEEKELVESWKDDDAETRGPLSPVRVSATNEGEELAAGLDTESANGVEERLEVIEDELEHWRPTYTSLKRAVAELEQELEEQQNAIEKLQSDVGRLQHARSEDDDTASLGDGFEFG